MPEGLIPLTLSVAVLTLLLILVGTLGGQVYNIAQPDIQAINDTNVKASVQDSITNAFKGLSTLSKYIPIIVVAVVIGLVLMIVFTHLPLTPRPTPGAL